MEEQRHTVIVKNHFQHRIILNTVLMTFITLNIIIILGYLVSDYFAAFELSKSSLSIALAALELVALVIVYLVSRRISFRIAGPVYAIEKKMRTFADGDLTVHITLRKEDYFHEVSNSVNQTIDNFHEHIDAIKENVTQLKQELIEHKVDSPRVEALLAELSFFKTGEEHTHTDKESGK